MLSLSDILLALAFLVGFIVLIFASKLLPDVIQDWLNRHGYTDEGFRERRRSKGLCEECGYDLRGSVDRCPECGATAPRKDT